LREPLIGAVVGASLAISTILAAYASDPDGFVTDFATDPESNTSWLDIVVSISGSVLILALVGAGVGVLIWRRRTRKKELQRRAAERLERTKRRKEEGIMRRKEERIKRREMERLATIRKRREAEAEAEAEFVRFRKSAAREHEELLREWAATPPRVRRRRRPPQLQSLSAIRVRIPRDADDFETVCCEFLKKLGHVNAYRTPKGPDGGIDVCSKTAVGQAKFHPSQKVSGEFIRALAGARMVMRKKEAFFFHYGPGYTPDAIKDARKLKVRLLHLDVKRRVFREVGRSDG
jgi:hypothetical protein